MEKHLKGFLLSKGWQLRRIHDLEALLNHAIGYDPSFEPFRADCQKITRYYVRERYPTSIPSGYTADEMHQSLDAAQKLVAHINRLRTK